MANKKTIRKASIRFAKQEPALFTVCQALCSNMARYIKKSGVPEVVVGISNGVYYEYPAK